MYKKNFVDDISQLKRRGTALKSATSVASHTNSIKDKGATSSGSKGIKSSQNRLNLAPINSNSALAAGTQNRRGSSLFRDMDRPLAMKSRTNSVTSPFSITSGSTTPTGHFSSLMSPKSTSYFSIPTLREEQQQKSRSSDRLQPANHLTTTSSQADNRNFADNNQYHRHHQNSSVATLSATTSPIHPSDPAPFTKFDGGLSKSLKMSLRKATRKASTSGTN